jgi:uncharacterized membrane protein YebE (DUF533 family)
MNTKSLLDQLLQSGPSLMQSKMSPRSNTRRSTSSGGIGGVLSGLSQGGLSKGAMASGALSMLMGSRRMGSISSQGLKYGSLAALGMLAYRAYSDYQKQNAGTAPSGTPRTIDRLSGAEADTHSHAILKALVAAAKADGHVDDRERQLIEEELGKLADDAKLHRWLQAELGKPLDPGEVASAASSPEIASEMYLVSLMMIDDENYMERAYLDELARKLKLAPALRANLERQAREAEA